MKNMRTHDVELEDSRSIDRLAVTRRRQQYIRRLATVHGRVVPIHRKDRKILSDLKEFATIVPIPSESCRLNQWFGVDQTCEIDGRMFWN